MRLRDGDVRSSRHRFAFGPTLSVCGCSPPRRPRTPRSTRRCASWRPTPARWSRKLPAWRGAAPVQRAVMAGDDVTGASTFLIEEGLDTGPVFGTMTETVRPTDTAGDLLGRLAVAGAGLLV